MGIIATEQQAASIGGGSPYTNNLCCTKARAQALGCTVSGSYANNQLVELSSLSAPLPTYKWVRLGTSTVLSSPHHQHVAVVDSTTPIYGIANLRNGRNSDREWAYWMEFSDFPIPSNQMHWVSSSDFGGYLIYHWRYIDSSYQLYGIRWSTSILLRDYKNGTTDTSVSISLNQTLNVDGSNVAGQILKEWSDGPKYVILIQTGITNINDIAIKVQTSTSLTSQTWTHH